MSRTTLTCLASKPSGASPSISAGGFIFATLVRCRSSTTALKIASKAFTPEGAAAAQARWARGTAQGQAEVRKFSVSATTQPTLVIDLEARGGEGGAGDNGGDATPPFTFSSVATFSIARSVGRGSDHTPHGRAGNGGNGGDGGRAGNSIVRMLDSRIELGNGNAARLSLRFLADGARDGDVVMARNVLDGGSANILPGVEAFWGGSRDHRFMDDGGHHASSGRSGADRVEDFTPGEDAIAQRGFGGPLDSFADAQGAAIRQATGGLSQTWPTSSVFLIGLQLADLQATGLLF